MKAIRGHKSPWSCSYGCCELPDKDLGTKLWSSKIRESTLTAQSSPQPNKLPTCKNPSFVYLFYLVELIASHSISIAPYKSKSSVSLTGLPCN